MTSLTINQYLSGFKTLYGAFTGLIGSLPLLAIFPVLDIGLLFPPLGNLDLAGKVITFLIGCVIVLAVYFMRDLDFLSIRQNRKKIFLKAISLILLATVAYFVVNWLFVYNYHLTSEHKKIPVSIGFERTTAIDTTILKGLSNSAILDTVGPDDEYVRYAWTLPSIIIARIGLVITYWLAFGPLVFLGAFFTLARLQDESGSSKSTRTI